MPSTARLPNIDGGWELATFPLAANLALDLWVPCAPDRLLENADVVERNRFNDSMPYWAWVWDSAPLMARLLAQDPPGAGDRILELGAGLGLTGIAAARLARGPADLTLSDHDPLALAALPVNAAHNGLDAAILDLDWRQVDRVPDEPYDLILGCDVAYEAGLHEPLLDVLDRLLAAEGRALFADPGRTRLAGFLRRAAARGYAVELVGADGAAAEPEPSEFRLATLRRDPARDSRAR